MSKLVVFMSMSLDGFVAAADDGPGRGLGVGGEPLHAWLEEGNIKNEANAEVLRELLATGAVIAGRQTYEWVDGWGGDHHDGVPMFVLTRSEPKVRGLTHYMNDLRAAVAEAKEAACDKNVM